MAKFLVLFSDNIDEIEINGFSVMTDKEIDNYEELARSITWQFYYDMGNDTLEYTNGEELLDRLEYVEVTNEEAKVIKKIFNNNFGVFITESFLSEIIGEEEDDDYDDTDDEDEYESYDDDY
jgi:hypothetical protein